MCVVYDQYRYTLPVAALAQVRAVAHSSLLGKHKLTDWLVCWLADWLGGWLGGWLDAGWLAGGRHILTLRWWSGWWVRCLSGKQK